MARRISMAVSIRPSLDGYATAYRPVLTGARASVEPPPRSRRGRSVRLGLIIAPGIRPKRSGDRSTIHLSSRPFGWTASPAWAFDSASSGGPRTGGAVATVGGRITGVGSVAAKITAPSPRGLDNIWKWQYVM